MNRRLPLSLAVAMALGSSSALALGLGGINVKSELNAPLRAEIPVYVGSPAEAESLRVELAAGGEFARVGLDIGDISVPLQFEVGKNARGEPVILVKSNQAIREPTLTFLVEVNWSNGRFLREYSVLLEPPVTVPVSTPSAPIAADAPVAAVEPIAEPEAAAPTPIAEPEPLPESEPAPVEPEAAATPEPMPAEPEPVASEPESVPSEPLASETPTESSAEDTAEAAPESTAEAPIETPVETPVEEPAAAAGAAPASASEYGPVAAGETLWEISNTTRPQHVTPSQMMLALLRANPDAFYRDNVNALKRGAILRIPGESDLQAMAAAEAAAEIVSQNQSWIEATQPTTVADASVASDDGFGSTTSSTSRPGSRLELVPPSSGQSSSDRPGAVGGTGDSEKVRAELARAKESLSSAQLESSELRSRVKELEGINASNQRLLTMKDSELRGLQEKLKAAEAAAEAAKRNAEAAAATSAQPLVTDSSVTETAATTEPVAATDDAASADPAVDPSVTSTTPEDTVVPSDSGVVDPLASSEPTIPADAATSPEPGASAEVTPIVEDQPVAVADPVAAAPEATPWYGALMNKYVLGGIGLLVLGGLGFAVARRRKPEAPAVKPGTISGQFGATVSGDNEESSMLTALAQDPTDLNAHLNMLVFYYMRRNADKFEAAAEAMYAQLPDPTAPEWQEVLPMGRDLCPTHPMFAEGGEAAPASGAFADPFASTASFEAKEPKATAPLSDDDFNFDDIEVPPPTAPNAQAGGAKAADDAFDFGLVDKNAAKAGPAQSTAAKADDFDFSLDLDQIAASPKAQDISLDLPELDLGLGKSAEPSTQPLAAVKDDLLGDDAVATKIDLARAYLDMGDADGARSMLEEVVAEGNETQQAEARKLLAEIR